MRTAAKKGNLLPTLLTTQPTHSPPTSFHTSQVEMYFSWVAVRTHVILHSSYSNRCIIFSGVFTRLFSLYLCKYLVDKVGKIQIDVGSCHAK